MGPQQKKTPRGGVFFFAAAPRGRSLTHCGPGWCLPLAGVVSFFLLRPRPDRGGVYFYFFAVAPPRRSLTHCGLGRFRQGSGGVFFFCCGPAGSFLVSLKRPGGAAAKKKTPRGGVFFFAAAPRGRSLTHCGPGWCLPLAGVVFFFAAAPPGPGWCFFLLWPRPDAHSLTVRWGDFGKVRVVFFFLLWPRPVFLGNSKKCLVYYIGSKKTRRGHNKKKNTTSLGVLGQSESNGCFETNKHSTLEA